MCRKPSAVNPSSADRMHRCKNIIDISHRLTAWLMWHEPSAHCMAHVTRAIRSLHGSCDTSHRLTSHRLKAWLMCQTEIINSSFYIFHYLSKLYTLFTIIHTVYTYIINKSFFYIYNFDGSLISVTYLYIQCIYNISLTFYIIHLY